MSLEPLLEMQGISKTFNGLRVLKTVGQIGRAHV